MALDAFRTERLHTGCGRAEVGVDFPLVLVAGGFVDHGVGAAATHEAIGLVHFELYIERLECLTVFILLRLINSSSAHPMY